MIRMSAVFAAVYFFYLFEMIAGGIAEQRKKVHIHSGVAKLGKGTLS